MSLFSYTDKFVDRHCGVNSNDLSEMLEVVGVNSLDELIGQTVPAEIRLHELPEIPEAISEKEFLEYISILASKNIVAKSYIGLGYSETILPPAILRNILENPGWYTQYTPYQAEISQGRLEALLNFQTMISDLTSLPIANASLLDEATAATEAMIMLYSNNRAPSTTKRNKFFVSDSLFEHTIDVLETRAEPLGIEIVINSIDKIELDDSYFGCIFQFPDAYGNVSDYSKFIGKCAAMNVLTVAAADLLSLAIFTPPGEFGVDVCVGSTQRFGIPMGFGGPHAAFFACKDIYKRVVPGRIIGASIDSEGRTAYRMALQTREQHIKREKATSNICTAQVLLAIMASMYGVYHGPNGLKNIAMRIWRITHFLNNTLSELGYKQINSKYFDTLNLEVENTVLNIVRTNAESLGINLRYIDDTHIGISIGETVNYNDAEKLISIFSEAINLSVDSKRIDELAIQCESAEPNYLVRSSKYLQHKIFNSIHTETELMRYAKKLESRDLSLTASMIPLGSCTMKLNSASEMLGISMTGFTDIHPFAPAYQVKGYTELIDELALYLARITGFDAVSFQPNSGAQGEYAGLLVMRNYFIHHKEYARDVILIPSSAHGTNPASAVMAGMKVVVVNCDERGNIDVDDLRNKAILAKNTLAGLMVTYPSTHGVFEGSINEICNIIHDCGGLVYMDGANMNAQVMLTQPALIGADVCHLNLHKTFAIPHGGGGPGMGPICVTEKLKPFLPAHKYFRTNDVSAKAVSAAQYGSALILIISLGYIKMLGKHGLKHATSVAILNANYLKSRLEPYYEVLYTGENSRVAHELIFDFREFKKTANIEVEDVAKRLMDFGFHAPTVSFPVPGTLMVEPTESESKYELDRFVNALICIREEIKEIENGTADKADNVLKNAPHTIGAISATEWKHSYTREKAAFPVESLKSNKFWPYSSRINNAYGDRNLVCSCNSIESYR